MNSFLTAFGFLTILPGAPGRPTAQQIGTSRAFYPIVGLVLGGLLVGLAEGLRTGLPDQVTGAFLVAALVIVTRGFHLDGLMDVCDGLFGGYTKERRLEIMRDSHVGAFAVAGAIIVTLLKWTAVASMLSFTATERIAGLLLFPVLSRWSMVLLLAAFPYARTDGLGSAFHQTPRLLPTVAATALTATASVLIAGFGGLIIFGAVGALALSLGKGMAARLGGLTGDTYGAANELMEVASLVLAVALIPHGFMDPLHELFTS